VSFDAGAEMFLKGFWFVFFVSVVFCWQFFHDDIHYLLSMENLWKKRKRPTPLDLSCLPDASGEQFPSGH